MGKYTLHENQIVDATVEGHLIAIRDCVLYRIHPEALLLSGSFGRGEGSVHIKGSNVCFFSDYEISLISSSPFARLTVDQIQRDINQSVPVAVSFFWTTPHKIKNNLLRNLSFGPPQPSIGIYELKAGSKVFYGDFDLSYNLLDPCNLPISEGVRLIVNRMMEVVEKRHTFLDQAEFAFSLSKLILACGDALLLKHGLYHYSYAERARRFIRDFDNYFLPVTGPDYKRVYSQAASFKLLPFEQIDPEMITANLTVVRHVSLKVLQSLLNMIGKEIDQTLLAIASSVPIGYQTGIFPLFDSHYENVILLARGWRSGIMLPWGKKPNFDQPLTLLQILYGAIPALFWGLPLDGVQDNQMIQKAAFWGQWMLNGQLDSHLEFEDALANSLLDVWHAFG